MHGIDLTAVAQQLVDPEHDRAVKRGYLRWFAGCERVLDLGCGRGAFLEVAKQAGLAACGIDVSAAAVESCRARGLDAEVGDALAAMCAAEGVDGVLLAHLVEHLQPEDAAELLTAIAAALRGGGRLVVVTPNVRSLVVLEETFWLDPTHVRPYPRALLERLGRAAGLEVVASYDDPATRPRRPRWKQALSWLRSRLSGADRATAMDAVVVFRRPRA